MSKKLRTSILILALVILAGGVGYRLGERKTTLTVSPRTGVVLNQEAPAGAPADFSLFWDVWQRLFRSYIDKAELDTQKMVWGAITGMVSSLGDPYTVFLPPKENTEFKEDLGGAFEGIGAQLGIKDNTIMVIAPLKGNPAEKAGIRAGDYIVKVNGEPTTGWTVPQAVTKIRGRKGTKVTLSVLHAKSTKPEDITLTRDTILVPSVEAWIKTPKEVTEIQGTKEAAALANVADKVAYLRLTRFGDRTNDEWEKAVNDIMVAERMNGSLKGMIFDLRNNPGGYLDGAVFIASEFLKRGLIVVSQVNSDSSKYDYRVTRDGRLQTIPVVVLINKGSASAAEIVAGALRDHKRAQLVGEISFGKGSVQTPEELPGGAGLHITTGKWLIPSGDSISKVGIKPNIEVELGEDITATADAQLSRAIQELLR